MKNFYAVVRGHHQGVFANEEDAKKLVEHLRKNNLGRASFLPISSVKGKKLDKIKRKLGA